MSSRALFRPALSFVFFAIASFPCIVAYAAPTIASVSPHGLEIGRPTTVVLTGADLTKDVTLVCEAKIASQHVKAGAKAGRVEIELTLDATTPPGLYAFRAATASGISNPLVIGVDRLPQRAFGPTLEQLPAAYSGMVNGAQVLNAKLSGKKDQRLIIDVEAQRIGSGLRPVLRLNDSRGTQIAWSPPRAIIGGDARIETKLPADAEYTLELHDELFRPATGAFFRLKVGDLQYADLAWPPAVSAGGKQVIRYAGSNVEGSAEINAVEETIPSETFAPAPMASLLTGAAPRIAISDLPELLEQPATLGEQQKLPKPPLAVSGVLSKAGEEDVYLLAVTPKQKLRFDVVARQFGSPLDGVLTIRKEDGTQLTTGDDRAGSSDPLVDFTIPAGVNHVYVAIKDLLGRGGSDFVYRLQVRDQSRPEFSLSLATDRLSIPAGASQVVPVQVARTNYNGPIEVFLSEQPGEISLGGNVIPPGATIGLITVSAQDVSPQAALTRLVGRAVDAKPAVLRAATFGGVPGSDYQPRLKSELGLAISHPSPIGLTWLAGTSDQLYLGGKMPARVQFPRQPGTPGKIRLKLVSSQPTPKKTIKQGLQDRVVDDPDRTLRLEGDATFGPDTSEATVQVLVPSDLPKQPWNIALVAELLSPDGKSVVSSLASEVRTLMPVAPFTLALTSGTSAEGKAGVGSPGTELEFAL